MFSVLSHTYFNRYVIPIPTMFSVPGHTPHPMLSEIRSWNLSGALSNPGLTEILFIKINQTVYWEHRTTHILFSKAAQIAPITKLHSKSDTLLWTFLDVSFLFNILSSLICILFPVFQPPQPDPETYPDILGFKYCACRIFLIYLPPSPLYLHNFPCSLWDFTALAYFYDEAHIGSSACNNLKIHIKSQKINSFAIYYLPLTIRSMSLGSTFNQSLWIFIALSTTSSDAMACMETDVFLICFRSLCLI